MSASRLEWKVGLFVLVCLVVLGTMMIKFSKGLTALGGTYPLRLTTLDVGGVQENAPVRMAGVKVGQVKAMRYDSQRMEVVMDLEIRNEFRIPATSLFTIETAGFLGEQYVAISPQASTTEFLQPGQTNVVREPFNIQEAARSAMQLIQNVDRTVSNLNAAVIRVDRTLLAEETLTNITATVGNFRQVSDETLDAVQNFRKLSERAERAVDGLTVLVETNSPAVSQSFSNLLSFTEQLAAVSNLVAFSEHLNKLGAELRETVATNRADVTAAVQNLEAASGSLKDVLAGLQAGKGLAGSLLKDPALDAQASLLLSNLTTLSSNLNRFGLLYKPKPPKTSRTNAPVKFPFPNKWPFDH